jgi:hypothetical protein
VMGGEYIESFALVNPSCLISLKIMTRAVLACVC